MTTFFLGIMVACAIILLLLGDPVWTFILLVLAAGGYYLDKKMEDKQ